MLFLCVVLPPPRSQSFFYQSFPFRFIPRSKFPFVTVPTPKILTHFICCLLGKKIKGHHFYQFKLSLNKGSSSIYTRNYLYHHMVLQPHTCSMFKAGVCSLPPKKGEVQPIANKPSNSSFPAEEDRAIFASSAA